MKILTWATTATLIVSAVGEATLRGQQVALRADHSGVSGDSPTSVQTIKSDGLERRVLNFFRRQTPDGSTSDVAATTDWKEFGLLNIGEMMVSFILWAILYALASWYYFSHVRYFVPVDKKLSKQETKMHFDDFKDFKSSVLDCSGFSEHVESGHGDINCWACCCPGIRWSDTMSKIGIHSYWAGFAIMSALEAIGFIPFATIPCYLIVVIYMTHHRQKFRETFEMEETSWCSDFMTVWCCILCTVAQEARHVRDATLVGHPAIVDHGDPAVTAPQGENFQSPRNT